MLSKKKGKKYEEIYGKEKAKRIKEKIRKKHLGLTFPDRKKPPPFTVKHKQHIRNGLIGNQNTKNLAPWNKGLRKENDERVRKYSEKQKGILRLCMQKEKHPMWKGGHSRVYPINWYEIRKQVYRRDKYTCQGKNCKNIGKRVALDVHHIDNNPKNNILTNLISLCRSCHVKIEWQFLKQQQTCKCSMHQSKI